MAQYLIKDFTNSPDDAQCPQSNDFVCQSNKELVGYIDRAKDDDLKIAIFEIGDCILDWS